jgi:hypothetical protein
VSRDPFALRREDHEDVRQFDSHDVGGDLRATGPVTTCVTSENAQNSLHLNRRDGFSQRCGEPPELNRESPSSSQE